MHCAAATDRLKTHSSALRRSCRVSKTGPARWPLPTISEHSGPRPSCHVELSQRSRSSAAVQPRKHGRSVFRTTRRKHEPDEVSCNRRISPCVAEMFAKLNSMRPIRCPRVQPKPPTLSVRTADHQESQLWNRNLRCLSEARSHHLEDIARTMRVPLEDESSGLRPSCALHVVRRDARPFKNSKTESSRCAL
jgi:hypothetical protein